MASEKLPVQMACRVLGVAESGYYERLSRPPSARALRHVWLTDQIQAVHAASFGTYGSRRVHAELRIGLGIAVGHGAVEMLISRAGLSGLSGLPGRMRRRPVHETPFAGDLVDRQFARDRPDQLWVTAPRDGSSHHDWHHATTTSSAGARLAVRVRTVVVRQT